MNQSTLLDLLNNTFVALCVFFVALCDTKLLSRWRFRNWIIFVLIYLRKSLHSLCYEVILSNKAGRKETIYIRYLGSGLV